MGEFNLNISFCDKKKNNLPFVILIRSIHSHLNHSFNLQKNISPYYTYAFKKSARYIQRCDYPKTKKKQTPGLKGT